MEKPQISSRESILDNTLMIICILPMSASSCGPSYFGISYYVPTMYMVHALHMHVCMYVSEGLLPPLFHAVDIGWGHSADGQ